MAHAPKSGTRQLVGFSLVVLLHLGIIYALKTGLASSLIDVLKGPLQASLVEEIKPQAEAPPPPPPKFQALPPPVVIPVDISVEAPAESNDSAIDAKNKNKAAPPPQVASTPPRSNPRRPVTQPDYPPTSKRLGEAGTVVLLLTVDESGKVTEAKIQKSSGFERLDQAALQEALRAWRLLPGTVGGKPTTMTYPFAVTFKITD